MKCISLFLLCLALCGATVAQGQVPAPTKVPAPATQTPAPAQPMGMVVAVGAVEGKVQVKLAGSAAWTDAKVDQLLPPGTEVQTAAKASAVMAFSDGTKIRLGPNTSFKVEEAAPSRISVFIGLGRLEAWVKKLAGRSFQARSPVAVAAVRGTTVGMDVARDGSTSFNIWGEAIVTDQFGNRQDITNQQLKVTPEGLGELTNLPTEAAPVEPVVDIPIAQAAAPPDETAPAEEEAPTAVESNPAPTQSVSPSTP